ncbi:MAG: purine-nucleoside phosphorylase [Clostridium sp.]|nr:purine-nucleoside phosphorylase [Clostridium sp.]MCM1444345.1 purine-nucleoside phosphorylase [Candidatus Amulumruptor caecigallinarius]
MTPHISAKKGEIAKTVIMPGDPLRAKFIAEKFLENVRIVNTLRNMYAYTGTYNGNEITVMGSGMGIPSIGIYSYELYKFYDVENIIRIGTCGSNREDIKILDVLLATSSYSLSTFAELFDGTKDKVMQASTSLNEKIIEAANKVNIPLKVGTIITSDVFNVYVDNEKYMSNYPSDLNSIASEMEAYGLFFIAKILNKKASCLLTVVDSPYDSREITGEERQNSLNEMIKIALDTSILL